MPTFTTPKNMKAWLNDTDNQPSLLRALITANGGPITIDYECLRYANEYDDVVVAVDPASWNITIGLGSELRAAGAPLRRPKPGSILEH